MQTKHQRYQQLIKKATKRLQLFHKLVNQQKKSNVILQTNVILPSSHPFKSSQQIDNNISITYQITNQTSKQHTQNIKSEWPQSCIGLVLCEHHQNNQTYSVYGTGTLIHSKIVLTSAQNLYCRRLHKQYVNIKFITSVNVNKCSGIYDIKQTHYPKEYTLQQEYENYNFAVLQLYDDLSNNSGYVGWKTSTKPPVRKLISYGYRNDNNDGFFKLQQLTKKNQLEFSQGCSGSGVLMKGKESNYYIVGLNISSQTKQYSVLSDKMRSRVNSWISETTIDLRYKNIDVQECMQLSKENNWIYLTTINLNGNNINAQGYKYLSQANWKNLTKINLNNNNNISAQSCKYLSRAQWIYLNIINLAQNNINSQGCKYLSQANWRNLTQIYLYRNKIEAEGCKYLIQAKWPLLTKIYLFDNKIDVQGCKYLCQANWMHLRNLSLYYNNAINVVDKMIIKQLWINAEVL